MLLEMSSPKVFSYPQLKNHDPIDILAFGGKSPTFNRKTHDRWGSHHLRSLDELHKSTEPTHWATLKFNRLERVDTINALLDSLGTAVRYQNKKKTTKSFSGTLAIFGVMNPESDGSVHYHLLVRSTLPDPAAFLNKKITSHNRKHGTIASICYCEHVNTVKGATTYGFKLGSDDKLIFCSGSGLRHVFQCGNYFDGKLKRALERRNLWTWQDKIEDKFLDHLRAMEIAADKIVDGKDDFAPSTPPKRTIASLRRLRFAPPILLRNKAQHPLLSRKRTKSRPRIRSPCEWS
jgi:hypothetical protein